MTEPLSPPEFELLEHVAAEIKPLQPTWLVGKTGHDGRYFCWDCAEARLAESVDSDVFCTSTPVDTSNAIHCATCGCHLDYNLNPSGALAELFHFSNDGISDPLEPETAYRILRLLEAAPDCAEVIDLARRAIAFVKNSPAALRDLARPPANCRHEDFFISSEVDRVVRADDSLFGFSVTLKVKCASCGLAFEFQGLPAGESELGPVVSLDGQTARLAITPKGLHPTPAQRLQYGARSFQA